MQIPHVEYITMRNVSAQLYFNWLDKEEIFEKLHRPETIESIFYQKRYSTELMPIVEQILLYMQSFNVLKHAGGTFTLTREYDTIRQNWKNKFEIPPKYPIVKFIKKGLSMLQDRLESATGEWDHVNDHFTIERAFSNEGWWFKHPDIINLKTVNDRFKKPSIAIYGLFPQNLLEWIQINLPDYRSIKLMVPDAETKKQVISYCEMLPQYSHLSPHVEVIDRIFGTKFDLVFVPNGLFYKFNIKQQINLFEKMVNDNGYLYLPDNAIELRSGLEFMLFLDPNYPNITEYMDYTKLMRTSNFGIISKSHKDSPFVYFRKEA